MSFVQNIVRDPLFFLAAFFVLLPSLFQMLWGVEGRMMISSPQMKDKLFQQSVIYISDHTIDGAVGYVLNKPYMFNRPEVISGFSGDVFWGGPLKDREAVSIFYFSGQGVPVVDSLEAWQKKDARILTKVAAQPDKYRVLIGFCGWQALQLDLERLKKGWIVDGVHRSSVVSVWSEPGESVWRKTLEESGFYKKSSLARRVGA